MSNREQALEEVVREAEEWISSSAWSGDHETIGRRNRLVAKLRAALALPADAAEPRVEKCIGGAPLELYKKIGEILIHCNHFDDEAITYDEGVRRIRALVAASPSAVLTEERRQELIEKVLKLSIDKRLTFQDGQILSEVADLLSAPAQPTRPDRIDNITRDSPGEGKL